MPDVPGQEGPWLVPSFQGCGAVGAVLRWDLGCAPSMLLELHFGLKGFVSMSWPLPRRGTRRGRCGSTTSEPGPTTAFPAIPGASWISWRRCTTSRRAFLMQGLWWCTAGERWAGLLLLLLLLAQGAETFKKGQISLGTTQNSLCFLSVQCPIPGGWHRVPLGRDFKV